MSFSFTRTWLIQKQFTGKHITTYTHLLLSGGKVNVPKEYQEEMYKLYAKDIIEGNANFITEMRTPIFKFHMDLDFLDNKHMNPEEIIEYCKIIQEAVKQLLTWKSNYNPKKLLMIISISPEQTKMKNGSEYIKCGIHLNWPYLKVNTYLASIIREGCIQYLNNKYGERHKDNMWSDVIDKAVYTNNGLRWIYSDKADKCPDCYGKKNNTLNPEKYEICCRCHDSKKIPANRIYKPILILNGDNEILNNEYKLLIKKSLSYTIKCVKLLSIKSFDKNPNVEIKEPFPLWYKPIDIVLKTKYDKSKRESNPIVKDNLGENQEIKKTFAILENIDKEDKRYIIIKEFIENFLPEEYSDAEIVELMFCGKKTSKFRSYIVRTNSKYCQNIQDEHNSNHVYFVITEDKFHQRCFCRCDIVRPSGIKCCDYIDKGKILSSKMKQILFPKTLEVLNEKKEQIKYNPNKLDEIRDPMANILEQFGKYF